MTPLRISLVACAIALGGAPYVAPAQASAPGLPPARPSFAEPSLSPDGSEIAFVSGGDIWTVPRAGGEARLLVSHPAEESRPIHSPDGTRVAFVSTRTGNGDVYVLTLATGELRRLTWDDVPDQLDGWSRDGKWLYFSSSSRDVAGMQDVWRVSADGGTPMQVAADRYVSEYWAAEAPGSGGDRIAITARGVVAAQWWRNGHSHLDESEIWVVSGVAPGRDGVPGYTQVTARGAKSAWPMWSPDGASIHFMSDRGGAENLWTVAASGGEPRPVTRFTSGRVLWPSIAADGRTIVFERDFGIWSVDVATGEAHPVPITLRGAPATPTPERERLSNGLRELALSPDARKVAFVVRGEVFAASAKDGGDAARVTTSPALDGQLAWAPDSRRLAFASDREGHYELYLHDFGTGRESRLTTGEGDAVLPTWSPDGKRVAYLRGGRELRVLDPATGRDRVVARGAFRLPPFLPDRPFAWSPDGRWIAFSMPEGSRQFTNLFVVGTEGGESRQVSWLPHVFGGTVSWSPDGTYLLMTTTQRTEPTRLARVDLVPRTPRFREDQFRGLFEPAPARTPEPGEPGEPADTASRNRPAPDSAATGRDSAERGAPPRTEIVFDGIRERLSFVDVGLPVSGYAISPDGKQLAFTASVAGQTNVHLYPLDELADERVARQLTSTPGPKGELQWSSDGREIFFLAGGRISAVKAEGNGAPRTVAVTADMEVDFATDKAEVFAQAWRYLRDNFYDEAMHGVDWEAARATWAPHVAGARTPGEMRRLLALMVGELNASHLGVGGPAAQQPYTGRLGVRFDRAAWERDGRLRISEILPLGPVALAGGVRVGDVITAVDGHAVERRTNLDSLLAYRTERRTELTITPAAGGATRTLAVLPVSVGTAKGLVYRAWVESRRDYVSRISGGRLGYVHIFDMSQGSLDQLHLDLDAGMHEREGVVIDVRNNNGGFVNAYALDVFARRPYLTMQSRGFGQVPARTQLGQRSLERPTVLVTNQHSLSDAEDFTEGYRAMGLGQVVGEPTAGWIIYTSNTTLVDGTTLRLPFQRVRDAAGRDMELVPRPVDVPVTRPVGEGYTARDSQLDAAVRVLLGTVETRRADGNGGTP